MACRGVSTVFIRQVITADANSRNYVMPLYLFVLSLNWIIGDVRIPPRSFPVRRRGLKFVSLNTKAAVSVIR
jgi:hypothetical protein